VVYADLPPEKVRVLDKYAILHACRVTNPHMAVEARLPSIGFNCINEKDIMLFSKSLVKLDLSDNDMHLD
jgi:hypothetical protein